MQEKSGDARCRTSSDNNDGDGPKRGGFSDPAKLMPNQTPMIARWSAVINR